MRWLCVLLVSDCTIVVLKMILKLHKTKAVLLILFESQGCGVGARVVVWSLNLSFFARGRSRSRCPKNLSTSASFNYLKYTYHLLL